MTMPTTPRIYAYGGYTLDWQACLNPNLEDTRMSQTDQPQPDPRPDSALAQPSTDPAEVQTDSEAQRAALDESAEQQAEQANDADTQQQDPAQP